MNKFFKKIKLVKGVSLLELIFAITIFSFLILSATQIFKMVIEGQRNAIGAQNVQENMRYAMERMSKEIRMARISNHECEAMFSAPMPTAIFKVFNTDDSGNKFYFKNKDGYCVVYYLENNRLKIKADSAVGVVDGFITPANIEVTNLKFYVDDDLIGAFHSKQPYVTMKMDIKASAKEMHQQQMKIQTTVSSRYYE